jgi:excisionase family DNA binding protein
MRGLFCIFPRKKGTDNFLSILEVRKMSETDLLTTEELAERLHVRPSTVREWARREKIPTVRLSPKVVRYSLAAVVESVGQARPVAAKGVPHAD